MIKALSFLPVLLISSTVLAGTYTFNCTGYSQNPQTGQNSQITLSRDTATAESFAGGELQLLDTHVDLLSDTLHYQDETMRVNLNVTVSAKSVIYDVVGNYGHGEENIKATAVNITADADGQKINYVGTCTENIVTGLN